MNFQLSEYDQEVFGIQEGLQFHEFEKQKNADLIKQIDEEIKEIQLKIQKLKDEFLILSDKKQDFTSKLELYRSLSEKLKDNIQRIASFTKTANKNLIVAKNNLNLAKNEFDEKLNSKKILYEKRICQIEESIQIEINTNVHVVEKIISYNNKLQMIENLKNSKSDYLREIMNQKSKNNETWLSLKKNIVKIASSYKNMMERKKIKETEVKLQREDKQSNNQIMPSSSTYTDTNNVGLDFFLKPFSSVWTQNKPKTPISKTNFLTSTPLSKIPEHNVPDFRENQIDYAQERECFRTPTILIPKLNLTLTPIPRKNQKNNQYLRMRMNKLQIAEQLETLDEDPLSNNLLDSQVANFEENKNSSKLSAAFDCDKSLNLTFSEVENQSGNFPELQFGFKASYLNKNKSSLNGLNLFKE